MAKQRTFTERLLACQNVTEMTVSDLARWFDRPRATVNTWLLGRTPFGPQAELADRRLEQLEDSVARRGKVKGGYYPIPAHLTWPQRQRYVRGMRDDAERHSRVPAMRASG